MTDKKNQHYIPKFYLRRFSYNNNEKQIGLYNFRNTLFFPTASLKNQGSKDFFYGTDGIIEEGLSEIEGKLAETLRQIIKYRKIPIKYSKEHIGLLTFVALTHLRNPVVIQNFKDLIKTQLARVKELDPSTDLSQFFPDISHEDTIQLALGNVSSVIDNIADLDIKLLINRTALPFITSDFPVIKCNQYLMKKKWKHGRTGYGATGLQIIVPLTDDLSILLYDGEIYNVGDKKKDYLWITKEKDVRQLNTLQVLNCFETIYFSDKGSESEIKKIAEERQKFTKSNEAYSNLHFLMDGKTDFAAGKENLIVSGTTEIELNFKISGMIIKPAIKDRKLSNMAVQLRSVPMQLMGKREK